MPFGIATTVADERGYRRITTVEELEQALREDGFTVWRDGESVCAKFSTNGVEVRYGPESHLAHLPWSLYPTHWRVNGADTIIGHEVRFEEPVAIPVLDSQGQPTGEIRNLRYRGPQRAPVVMDCPARFQPLLSEGAPLIVTEGVKKADVLTSYYAVSGVIEICCVALRGVAMWSTRNGSGERVLLHQWDDVNVEGREIVLLFDSDVAEKREVQHEMRALGEALTARGGKVFWSPLPAGPGQKIGLDDYLIAGGRLDDLQVFPVPPLSRPRVRVNVGGGDLYRMVDESWMALVGSTDPVEGRLMTRGSELVYYSPKTETLRPYKAPSLKEELTRAADFGKFTQNGRWSPTIPTDPIVNALLMRDASQYTGSFDVNEVRTVPFLGPNGEFVTERGVYEDSGVYYNPNARLNGAVQDPSRLYRVPTSIYDIQAAVAELETALGDFCYQDAASRANAYAMMITPFVKPYINGPCPMFTVTGPDKGQGKTLLCRTAMVPGCAKIIDEKKVSANDDEELRKYITAQMLDGAQAIMFGNMNGGVRSTLLASVLTATKWDDRVLQESKIFSAPIKHIWILNGRNVQLSDELQDRSVTIVLDAGGENLRDRDPDTWQNHREDVDNWALEDRNFPGLVAAIGSLIANWLAGEYAVTGIGDLHRNPRSRVAPDATMGSFAAWSTVVGGILRAAGIDGFLDNKDSQQVEADVDRVEAGEFLEAWFQAQLQPAKAFDILNTYCQYGGILHNILPASVRDGHRGSLEFRFRAFLGQWRGTNLNGYKLIGEGPKNRSLLWSVDRSW